MDSSETLEDLLKRVDPTAWDQLGKFEKRLDETDYEPPPGSSLLIWLNPQGLEERAQHVFSHRSRVLGQIRNVFTLLPLIFTWLSLSIATLNYGVLVDAGKLDPRGSFLDLWQGRFSGIEPIPDLTLSEVALVDVILLICLLIVSHLLHRSDEWAMNEARYLRQLVEQRVHEIFDRIERQRVSFERGALRDIFSSTADDFRVVCESLAGLTGDVAAERVRQAELTKARETEYGKLVEVASSLSASTGILIGYAREVRVLTEALSEATGKLQVATSSMAETASGVGSAAAELTGLRSDLRASLEAIVGQTSDQAAVVRTVAEAHGQLRGSLVALAEGLSKHVDMATTRAEKFEVQATEHQRALNELIVARERQLDELAKGLAEQTGQQFEQLNLLIGKVPSARELASEFAVVWKEAQAAELTRQNEQLRDRLVDYVKALKTEVVDPLKSTPLLSRGAALIDNLHAAIARLDGQMGAIHQDALALGKAVRGLTGAFDGKLDDSEPAVSWLDPAIEDGIGDRG